MTCPTGSLPAGGGGRRLGDQVAVQLPTIPEFVVAYLGILKNGSVVVPLNPLLKAGELECHLAGSRSSARTRARARPWALT